MMLPDDQKHINGTGDISELMFRTIPMLKKKLGGLYAMPETHGMPNSQVQLLMLLDENGTMSVTQISQWFGITKPNITPMVDRMISLGYVYRERSKRDRRIVNVVIQEAGREKLALIRAAFNEQVVLWTSVLTEDEVNEFAGSLASILKILTGM